jgi:hypothetical protein
MQVSKDTPLQEVTLRRYEKPSNLSGRNLIRKLCLSVGLLQVGDSRDVIVDVLHALLSEKKELSSEEIIQKVTQLRQDKNLPMRGIAPSNIRRQIKRLREIYLVEKRINKYRVTELQHLSDTFEEKVEKFMLASMLTRIKEYVKAVDMEFMS